MFIVRRWKQLSEWYGDRGPYEKALLWPASGYALLTLTMCGFWLFAPAVLAKSAMRDAASAGTPPRWNQVAKAIALVKWLGGTQRALDAWLKKHNAELRNRFDGSETVRTRITRYVDLGNESDVKAWSENAKTGTGSLIGIAGPGGCGKSTLAFQMAIAGRDAVKSHPVVPVLVDEDWGASLVEYVASALRIGTRRPTAGIVRKLGATGRLILVADGLSERRDPTAADQIREAARNDFRYVLATSRETEQLPTTIIKVGPLDETHQKEFVEQYVGGGECPADPDEVDRIVSALRTFTKGKTMRPLFVRIAVERMSGKDDLPNTYADFVQEYVRGQHPAGPDALREDDFLRACRIVAYTCVKEDLAPRAVAEEFLRGRIDAAAEQTSFHAGDAAELTSAAVLDQLVQCGILRRSSQLAVNRVRFAEEPIGEYLAMMQLKEMDGRAISGMRRRIQSAGNRARGLADAFEQVFGKKLADESDDRAKIIKKAAGEYDAEPRLQAVHSKADYVADQLRQAGRSDELTADDHKLLIA